MTKDSKLLSAPSESYRPSKESREPSTDDCSYTFKVVTNVCHRGPTIARIQEHKIIK